MAWTQIANIKGPTGATGGTGPQGPAGPAGTGLNWKGAWSAATAYAINDAVTSGGSSYVCIAANTNQVPPNATYWNVLAQQGATGPTGTRGSLWYTGTGAPGTITGSLPGDMYLDTATGDIYQLS